MLKISEQQFYVYKSFLIYHSSYFKSLFTGSFEESQKSEIELKDIDPNDFQDFLELIYAFSDVNDCTIAGILKLADYFDAPIIMQRCEKFLLNRSELSLKFKFNAAIKYKLNKLKTRCMTDMQNISDFRVLSPKNATDFSQEVWKELYDNAMLKL